MDKDLEQAYDALMQADAAGNKEDAQQIADYIRTLESQQNVPAGKTSVAQVSDEDLVNVLTPTIGGAIAGEVVGPIVNKGVEAVQANKAPTTTAPAARAAAPSGTPFNPRGVTIEQSVQNWENYGQAQNEAAKRVRRESELHKKYPGFTRAQPPAPAATPSAMSQLRQAIPGPIKTAGAFLGGAAQSGVVPWLGRAVAGGAAGYQGADAYNRFKQGDMIGGGLSTIGTLGAGASFLPNPVTRYGGAAISAGAEGLNQYLDYLKRKSQQPAAAQPQQQEQQMPVPMKSGGLVHLAEGGGKLGRAKTLAKSVAAKMSPGMSLGKTLDETTQPSGRLVSSLANKFGYDEAKLAQNYPQTLFPILEKDKRTGNLFAGKATHPEAEAIKKARMFAQKEIAKGDYEPYFDITKRAYVDPAQYPLSGNTLSDAIPKTPDTIAKYEAIAKNPDALAQWQKGFNIGSERPLAKDWYAMKQLQDEYVRVLGPEEGIKQFKARFADAMGATTGGADPTSNLMTAAYTNVMRQRGMDIPTEGFDVPYPVYGRFLGQNLEQAKKLHETGGLSASTQPKRHNFSGNFLGHRDLSTLDEQMMSAYLDPKTGAAYTSPPGGAYGLFQRELNNLADKNQVMPANFQDVTWAGLKDYPGKPMIQEINELLHRTSRIGGMTQKEALENLIRADKPVYKEGGSTTPAWQRSEGKSPSGGLNALGRASYKRETGGELKAPQPEGGSRKKSFCARMGGMKKKLTSSETANDPDSRINKALRKWKC
jgi:hypothetical protein